MSGCAQFLEGNFSDALFCTDKIVSRHDGTAWISQIELDETTTLDGGHTGHKSTMKLCAPRRAVSEPADLIHPQSPTRSSHVTNTVERTLNGKDVARREVLGQRIATNWKMRSVRGDAKRGQDGVTQAKMETTCLSRWNDLPPPLRRRNVACLDCLYSMILCML